MTPKKKIGIEAGRLDGHSTHVVKYLLKNQGE